MIAAHLSEMFPGTVVPKTGLACKPAPVHFIEGACVEWTSWKGSFFVWSMMSPLWSPISQPTLSYSERLDHGRLFKGPPREIADQAARLIVEHDLFVQRLIGPETRLERFLSNDHSRVTPFSPERVDEADQGIALALLGDTKAALDVLTSLIGKYIRPIRHPFSLAIEAIYQSLLREDGNHLAIITEMERKAAQATKLTHVSVADLSGAKEAAGTHV